MKKNKVIRLDEEKNKNLIKERWISFETIFSLIEDGLIVDILGSPNYPNQKYSFLLLMNTFTS